VLRGSELARENSVENVGAVESCDAPNAASSAHAEPWP